MRFNQDWIKAHSKRKGDKEGRLCVKVPKDSYKDRFVKLIGNILFYYRTNSYGAPIENEPVGVLILERFKAQVEPYGEKAFMFSIVFEGEPDRKYFFSGQTQAHCVEWVQLLNNASISYIKHEFDQLREQIMDITGEDPIGTNTKRPRPIPRVPPVRQSMPIRPQVPLPAANNRPQTVGSSTLPNLKGKTKTAIQDFKSSKSGSFKSYVPGQSTSTFYTKRNNWQTFD